jgi:hypothetical protein
MCHLAWKYALQHSVVSGISECEALPVGNVVDDRSRTGAIRLTLEGGFLALFRSCIFQDYSYVSELVAHEVDRMLYLDRVPAVAFKAIEWNDILRTKPSEAHMRLLYHIRERCHNNADLLTGAVIGWTKVSLVILSGLSSNWSESSSE